MGTGADVVYAARALRRAPGFTLGVVLTLALGLGSNLAIFGVLDAIFLRPPAGVAEPDEVRRVWTERRFSTGPQFWSGYSYPQYAAIQSALGDRVATALYRSPSAVRLGPVAEGLDVKLSSTSASFFALLGARPAIGRFYTPDEDRLGAGAPVAVASEAFWRRQLGGERSAIGREIVVSGRPYTLIGVAGDGFTGVELDATDLWVPLGAEPATGPRPWWQNNYVNGFQILLRPRGAVGDRTLENGIAAALRAPDVLLRPADSANVVRLGPVIRAQGPGVEPAEITIATRLAGVTIVVFLVACANVINLLLARAVQRRREIAVRLAVGISRPRLARLLLTESVLLAMIATATALLAAWWGSAVLRALFLPDVHWASAAIDWRIITLAAALSAAVGIAVGLLPALQLVRTDLTGALNAGALDRKSGRSRTRGTVVAIQAALSVVLLVGAGLFLRSLGNVQKLHTGFDLSRTVLGGGVRFDTRDSLRDARLSQTLVDVGERLRHAPGVEQVALARMAPKQEFGFIVFHPDVDTTQIPVTPATYNVVSPEFFAATGMRMLRGEGFPAPRGATPPVVVVNEAMARRQWPGMEPLGRCLRFAPAGECYRVVGVVETALFDKLVEEPQPQFYLPLDNPPPAVDQGVSWLVVRSHPGALEIAHAEVGLALRDAFPGGRPAVATMETLLEPEYRPWRLGATLFTTFGLLALLVATIGIYSAVSYGVAQRIRDFGIRVALGARVPQVLDTTLRESLRPVAAGVVAGVLLALAGGRVIGPLLYGIEPGDPGVIAAVAIALLLAAAAATLWPALRAARVDPARVLRSD